MSLVVMCGNVKMTMVKPGKCLPPVSGDEHCNVNCNNDWDCDGLQKCCDIACGRECQDPCHTSCNGACVADQVCKMIDGCAQCNQTTKSDDKPGNCLPWNGPGPCLKNCVKDSDCTGNKKCCSIGCGRLCQDPCSKSCTWNCLAGQICQEVSGCGQCVPE